MGGGRGGGNKMWGLVLISHFGKMGGGGGHYKMILGVKKLKKCNITPYCN